MTTEFLRLIQPLGVHDAAKLDPEELAGYVLELLNRYADTFKDEENSYFAGTNYLRTMLGDAHHFQHEPVRAMVEAWSWLASEGYIAVHEGRWFVTRRGKRGKTRTDLAAMRRAAALSYQTLHPRVASKVWANFRAGDYETAVFAAFREVEIAVRDACGWPATEHGVGMIRKAFGASGPLADRGAPDAEQQAAANLFAGGYGLFRNAAAHRSTALTDPAEAAEMISLASLLVRLVDARRPDGAGV